MSIVWDFVFFFLWDRDLSKGSYIALSVLIKVSDLWLSLVVFLSNGTVGEYFPLCYM